jgi:hypothetical protein
MQSMKSTHGHTRRLVGGLGLVASVALAGSLGASASATESLYGITDKDAGGSAQLVRIDALTGETEHFRWIEIPQGFVPESMTFHRTANAFVIVLSAPDYHAPFALLRYEPREDATIVAPVSGFPPTQQKLHGIEYRDDTETLMVVFGASDAHLENRVASISLDGEAMALSTNLGVGDIDYLAWPDASGALILSDPNGHNGFARLLSLHDPFGTPHVEVYADTPFYAAMGDPAVRRSDLAFFSIQYDDAGGSLLRLVDAEYQKVGAFGTDRQVVGIAFATISCPGDLNQDGTVDGNDLAILIGAWGSTGGDLDGSEVTDPADLALLLGYWGSCIDSGGPAG